MFGKTVPCNISSFDWWYSCRCYPNNLQAMLAKSSRLHLPLFPYPLFSVSDYWSGPMKVYNWPSSTWFGLAFKEDKTWSTLSDCTSLPLKLMQVEVLSQKRFAGDIWWWKPEQTGSFLMYLGSTLPAYGQTDWFTIPSDKNS